MFELRWKDLLVQGQRIDSLTPEEATAINGYDGRASWMSLWVQTCTRGEDDEKFLFQFLSTSLNSFKVSPSSEQVSFVKELFEKKLFRLQQTHHFVAIMTIFRFPPRGTAAVAIGAHHDSFIPRRKGQLISLRNEIPSSSLRRAEAFRRGKYVSINVVSVISRWAVKVPWKLCQGNEEGRLISFQIIV